jgi:lipopolysaccharide export system permease protein
MPILTRYMLRTHVGPFLFALTVLTGLLFVNTVARRFEDLAGKGLALRVILEVFVLSLPHIIALTLPMAVLVAVLYSFSQLAADNEITALKASGTNLIRLLAPLVFAGVLLAGFMVWFNDRVLPETNHRLKNLLSDVARKSPTFELKEQVINPIQTQDVRAQYFLQAAGIDRMTNRLRDVVIYDLSIGQKSRTVYADSGRMAFNEQQTNLFLTLYDGWVYELDSYQAEKFQRVRFGQYLMMIEGVGDEFKRIQEGHRSDREMSLGMLAAAADTYRIELDSLIREGSQQGQMAVRRTLAGPGGLEEDPDMRVAPSAGGPFFRRMRDIPPDPLRFSQSGDDVARLAAIELEAMNSQAESLRQLIAQLAVEYHKKFAIPFACIVFVLLGAPIAVRFPRGGVGMVIGFSLLVFGIYYMSLIGGETLGDRGTIAPHWGPWGPNIIFMALALWGLARIGRETSTTRGGGWEDLWMTVRGVFVRKRRFRRARRARAQEATP